MKGNYVFDSGTNKNIKHFWIGKTKQKKFIKHKM